MALTFEYVKELDTGLYPHIAHEADSTIYNYFVNGAQAKDKSAVATLGHYDNIAFGNEDRTLTTKAVSSIGIKNFPGIGAIGFYKDAYLNEGHIVAPVHQVVQKYDAPELVSVNVAEDKLHIVITQPSSLDYTCFKVIVRQGDFAFEYTMYKPDALVDLPTVKGTYTVYCIGYDESTGSISEDSNELALTITTGSEDWKPEASDTGNLEARVAALELAVIDELPDIYVTKFELEEAVDELDGSKQEKLTPGENITIDEDNVISAVCSNYGLGIDNEKLYLIEDGISDNIPLATEEMIDNIPINGNCINTPMIYSTDEKKVGVWIDGKSIYQKTIHISSLIDNGPLEIDPQVNNLYEIIDFNGYCRLKDKISNPLSTTRPLPNVGGGSNDIRVDSQGGKIRIITFSNWWSNYEAYLTIMYTKTTD